MGLSEYSYTHYSLHIYFVTNNPERVAPVYNTVRVFDSGTWSLMLITLLAVTIAHGIICRVVKVGVVQSRTTTTTAIVTTTTATATKLVTAATQSSNNNRNSKSNNNKPIQRPIFLPLSCAITNSEIIGLPQQVTNNTAAAFLTTHQLRSYSPLSPNPTPPKLRM